MSPEKEQKEKKKKGRPKGSINESKRNADQMSEDEKERYNTLWNKKPSKRTPAEKAWMAGWSNAKVKCRKEECSLWIM